MVRWPNPKNLSLSRIKAARLAAARARHTVKPPDKQRTAWELAEFWKGFVAFCRDLTTITLGLVSVIGFAVAAFYLLKDVRGPVIAVAPISVPQDLAAKGYTSDAAAEGLQSALTGIISDAHSVKFPDVAMLADLPSIVVPSTALSTGALATQIRQYFHIYSRWDVSGEITIEQKQLKLHLRMNGRHVYTSPSGSDLEHPDVLFVEAAQKIFEEINPYVLAASLSESNPGKSLEIAKQIISDRPETDPSVSLAHNLTGLILLDQDKTHEAIAEYRKAIELDPRLSIAHSNLALALFDQHETEEAIAEYRKAIGLDPRYALAHNNMGNALRDQGKIEEAIAEYREAIDLDPRLAIAHRNLSDALRQQGKNDAANAELKKALDLEQKH